MAQVAAAVRMGPRGQINVPPALRNALGFVPGDDLVAYVEADRLVIERRDVTLARLQEEVSRIVPANVSLVDELLSERRHEAQREERR